MVLLENSLFIPEKFFLERLGPSFDRSIAVYGCFAAGSASLIALAAISWFSGKIDVDSTEETTGRMTFGREIRMTVYLITTLLALASSVISLIEVDQIAGRDIVPVRMPRNELLSLVNEERIPFIL